MKTVAEVGLPRRRQRIIRIVRCDRPLRPKPRQSTRCCRFPRRTRIRASDGALLGTFSVASNPFGVAFDGTNIWVANSNSDKVTKLRASDGAVLGTFSVGSGPREVAFDGANIWVVNQGDNNVTKL